MAVVIKDALRLIRVFHNLKQGALAQKLGVSQSHLSEIEGGQKQPTFDLLEKYAKVFDMPVSSIVYFAERNGAKRTVADAIAGKAIQMLNWVDVITDDKRKKA
jgi:transcriptional regulator with XRE-family HTH domain